MGKRPSWKGSNPISFEGWATPHICGKHHTQTQTVTNTHHLPLNSTWWFCRPQHWFACSCSWTRPWALEAPCWMKFLHLTLQPWKTWKNYTYSSRERILPSQEGMNMAETPPQRFYICRLKSNQPAVYETFVLEPGTCNRGASQLGQCKYSKYQEGRKVVDPRSHFFTVLGIVLQPEKWEIIP